MEAKDTVMSTAEMEKYTPCLKGEAPISFGIYEEIAEAQAEISFKAGQESAKEGHDAISYLEGYQEGEKVGREQAFKEMLGLPQDMKVYQPENIVDEKSYKAGIKEVVGWLEQYEESSCKGVFVMPVDVWQAKLKEWGIDA